MNIGVFLLSKDFFVKISIIEESNQTFEQRMEAAIKEAKLGPIPKIINQVWLDKDEWDNDLPPDKYLNLGYPQSWIEKNHDFQYILWNKKKVWALFETHPVLKKYREFFLSGLVHFIEKCDFSRFAIMYAVGGIYADTDFRCTKYMGPVIEGKSLQLWFEPIEHTEGWDAHIGRRLYNGFLASAPGHPFWIEWMDQIKNHYSAIRGVWMNTGPPGFSQWFQSKNYHNDHPEWLGDTCDVLPIISRQELAGICRGRCSNPIPSDKDFYRFYPSKLGLKPFDKIYAYTLWHEGAGWGQLTINNSKGSTETTRTKMRELMRQREQKLGISSSIKTFIPEKKSKPSVKQASKLNLKTPTLKSYKSTGSNPIPKSATSGGTNILWIIVGVSLGVILIVVIAIAIYYTSPVYKEKIRKQKLAQNPEFQFDDQ